MTSQIFQNSIDKLKEEIKRLSKLIKVKGSWGAGKNKITQKRYNRKRFLQAQLTLLQNLSKQVSDVLKNIDIDFPDDDGEPVNLSAEQFRDEIKTELEKL